MRLDHFIARKYAFTGNKSQQLIKSGLVSVWGKVILKAGFELAWDETIELKEDKSIAWVSRSAGKLDGFLSQLTIINYQLSIIGTNCLDVGSSTWWFTQILLDRWAGHVDAVDVGTDQLDERIRNNSQWQVTNRQIYGRSKNPLEKYTTSSFATHRLYHWGKYLRVYTSSQIERPIWSFSGSPSSKSGESIFVGPEYQKMRK